MLNKKVICGLGITLIATVCISAMMLAAANDTRVAQAAMRGDRDGVRSMLKQGADVNAAQGDGMTALHWAAQKDDVEMAQMLLYAGANVKATTRLGGITPLFLASQNGNAPMVETLLRAGSDPKATMVDGMTPLMAAASAGNADAVKTLLEHGADPNAKETNHQQTPLMFAAAHNRAEAIKALLARGADPKLVTKVTPATQGGGGFGGRGLPPNLSPDELAQFAAARGIPVEQLQALLAARGAGAPPADGQPAAAAAQPAQPPDGTGGRGGRGGRGGGGGGAPPNQAGGGGQQAGGGNNGNDDERILPGDAMGGMTALLYAARQGSFEAVRTLLDAGADINKVADGDKSSALLIACINGHFDLAMYMLERGADPILANVQGATPLYGVINVQWAPKAFYPQPTAKYEKTTHLEVMNALLDHGADVNARLTKELWFSSYNFNLNGTSETGTTAFWRAAQVADVDAMRLLIRRGADPNLANKDAVTPLLACSGSGFHGNDEVVAPAGRMAAVRYMVEELHADVNAADIPAPGGGGFGGGFGRAAGGYAAIHNAASRGDNEMILYLVSKGARVDAVSKTGQTTVDMANGPRQRIQPFPDTISILVSLGAKNSNKCVSC